MFIFTDFAGTQYSSACATAEDLIDNKENPPPMSEPLLVPTSGTIIVFDLETTGFGECDTTQLAAGTFDGKEMFFRNVLPERPITKGASDTTGLTIGRVGRKNDLLLNGKEVSCSFSHYQNPPLSFFTTFYSIQTYMYMYFEVLCE